MCGRCCAIVGKGTVERIAGSKRWRSGEHMVKDKYNLSPYDGNFFLPVIQADTAPASSSAFASSSAAGPAPPPSAEPALCLAGMKWGLIPNFAQNESDWRKNTFNARAERLTSSNLWNRCIGRNRRCIVVLQGFYEWGASEGKRPRFVQNNQGWKGFTLGAGGDAASSSSGSGSDRPFPLLCAGIYDTFSGSGSIQDGVSIITMDTPERSALRVVHDRIPLMFMHREAAIRWLTEETYSGAEGSGKGTQFMSLLNDLTRQFVDQQQGVPLANGISPRGQTPNPNPNGPLHIYEVSHEVVNSNRNESPECITSAAVYGQRKFSRGIGRFLLPGKRKSVEAKSPTLKAQPESAKKEVKGEPAKSEAVKRESEGGTGPAVAGKKPPEVIELDSSDGEEEPVAKKARLA